MARNYVVKRGDTLRKIARARLGDAALYRRIAEYNGILDPNRIAVGQRPEIPSRRDLRAPAAPPAPALARAPLPFPIPLSWDPARQVRNLYCHRRLVPGIVKVFESFGFTWGGRWSGRGKDPMHFQFCSGY